MAAIHAGVCSRTWCAAQGSGRPALLMEKEGTPTLLGSDWEGPGGKAGSL